MHCLVPSYEVRIITSDGYDQGPQILQKSGSHVQIPSARRVTWSEFHTVDHCFWSDRIVVWRSVLAVCELIYVVGMWGKKCRDCAESMRLHGPKLVALGDQSPGICAYVVYWMIFWNLLANLHVCRIFCNASLIAWYAKLSELFAHFVNYVKNLSKWGLCVGVSLLTGLLHSCRFYSCLFFFFGWVRPLPAGASQTIDGHISHKFLPVKLLILFI